MVALADSARLLPPNATTLERALARAAPRAALDALADVPAGLRRPQASSGALAPWLAAEWQLAEFAPYFDSTAALIEAGLPWLRQRGTAASVKRALSWLGYRATLEEEGPWLQIDPGDAYAQLRVDAVAQLVRASLPAHARLYRMYHGYDLRPLRLDGGRLDDALLDDDSGVLVDGVKLSFAARRAGLAEPPGGVPGHARTDTLSAIVPYDDRMMLDTWLLDSELIADGRFIMGQLVTGTTADTAATPATLTAHRTLALSQLLLDGDESALDDINGQLGGGMTVVERSFVLDGERLDSHDLGLRRIVIDRFDIDARAALAPALQLPLAGFDRLARHALFSGTAGVYETPTRAAGWSGNWSARRWRVTIPSTITFHNGA
ncbi:phage tail protein [Rugamonas rubra]|uniref:Phage tail protein (Tail_P2_I) n=1 Tax=Rugamonas rubra TaxID=758825 RepID=A0A1I4NEB7_9BURK|nr:phage tail protein [Rugamonas rubra]SFM13630.1 Phage tail protein (Tail_P2_I) [Rugamonas rubra]